MATRLFARSPRFVTVTSSANDDTRCDLYIWNDPASIPVTPTYVLSKPIPSTLITTVYYNISPYVREYIEHSTYTEVSSQTAAPVTEYCYCTAKTYINNVLAATVDFICFDGYGYFEDSSNPTFDKWLMTEGTYYVKESDNGGGLYIHNDGASNLQVKYSDLDGTNTTTINVTGTLKYFPYVHSSYTTNGNILTIYNTATASTIATYRFETQCEPKYTPAEVDFVNKYGMWQRLIFFKAKQETLEVQNSEYKMLPSSPGYSTSVGYKKPFNVNGVKSVSLNTGFVPEATYEAIQQLMLSEVIVIDGKHSKLKSKNVVKFTHINDKLINYRLEFEYANDVINNIM